MAAAASGPGVQALLNEWQERAEESGRGSHTCLAWGRGQHRESGLRLLPKGTPHIQACGNGIHALFTVKRAVQAGGRLCAEQPGNRGPRVVGHKCTLLKRSFHKVMLILNMKGKQHSLI